MSTRDRPREVVVDERPPCPHCGEPMTAGVARLCFGGGKGATVELPPTCNSRSCWEARDAAAIARAVEDGIIDP